MRLPAASLGWLGSVALAGLACGATRSAPADHASDSGEMSPDAAAEGAAEASAPDATALDGAAPDGACPTSLPLASWPGAPWDGGLQLAGAQQLLGYFGQLAQAAKLVVPAHQLDCTQTGIALGQCDYDPRQPAHDAADLHYSDALDRFVGPDDYDYVWVHVAATDVYLVADAEGAPASYELILSYVRCHGSEA